MLLTILSIIGLLIIIGLLFINLSPQFGGKHSKEDISRYEDSGHYTDGKFVNKIETKMDMGFKNTLITIKEFIQGNPNGKPKRELPQEEADSTQLADLEEATLLWFGHSAFFLKLDGKNILLDPMLGNTPAPHPLLGGKRFNRELPIDIVHLPPIDLVIISHDHYDHLDYESIQKLKNKCKQFYVPLGVGAHLKAWGIEKDRIKEFNWWEESNYEGLQIACTPARHFSGRGLTDNSTTLWSSWVIKGKQKNIYFSGDSGYGPHFKEIGEKYGPFDFAMMECGQYNTKWASIHMMPEETALAAKELKANLAMPIHWAAFTLALHDWNEPVIRMTEKAKEINLPVIVPTIGSLIPLDKAEANHSSWWLNLTK